jgi:hypothetical protein
MEGAVMVGTLKAILDNENLETLWSIDTIQYAYNELEALKKENKHLKERAEFGDAVLEFIKQENTGIIEVDNVGEVENWFNEYDVLYWYRKENHTTNSE